MKMTKPLLVIGGGFVLFVVLVSVIRLLLLLSDLGSFRSYWQKRVTSDRGEFVYIALGDSAAQGIGASKPEKGYVGLVADYVRARTGKEVRTINISVSGAKINDVLKDQLPKLKDLPTAHLITIEIGANDVLTYDAGTFKSEFAQLLDQLPDNTVVANIPSFAGGRLNRLSKTSIDASRQATSQITAHKRHVLADVHGQTQGLGVFDFAADFFHPNDRAYNRWARAFIAAIEEHKLLEL